MCCDLLHTSCPASDSIHYSHSFRLIISIGRKVLLYITCRTMSSALISSSISSQKSKFFYPNHHIAIRGQ